MNNKKFKARIDAGHFVGGNPHRNGWEISVTDDESLAVVCKITLTPDQFYSVLASKAGTVADGVAYDSFDRIGLTRESRNEVIQDHWLACIERGQDDLDAIISKHRDRLEVDGWHIRPINVHSLRRDQWVGDKINVDLVRYVEPKEDN